ncbi:MAG: hypothetical protein AMXMBFR79_12220 [Chitinophagaceae bacterium]
MTFANAQNNLLANVIDNNKTDSSAWLSVTNFGVVGDGIQNNTKSLQNAISYASKHKRTLYFPPGLYMTNAITLASDLTIKGEGRNTIIKAITTTAENYKFGCVFFSWYNSNYKNITIDNITLDGNATVFDSSLKAAVVDFSSCSNIFINAVTIVNSQSVGLALEKCTDVKVINCTFDNFGWSALMAIGVTNAQFIGNKTTGWSKVNLDIHPAWSFPTLSSRNVTINDNVFFNSSHATEYGIELYGAFSYQFTIHNNVLDANGYKGSGISGAFKFSTIKNNKFLNGTGSQRCGLEVHLDTSIVSGNIIENGSIASAPFHVVAHSQTGGIISNNIITNNLTQGFGIVIAGSGALDTTYSFEISGNTVRTMGNLNSAIMIGWYGAKGNYKGIAVYNNNIYTSINTNGIRFHGSSGKDVRVHNNYINGSISGITNDSNSPITGIFDIANNTVINSSTGLAVKTNSKVSTFNNRTNSSWNNTNEVNKEIPNNFFYLSNSSLAPSNSKDKGTKGEIRVTASYIYMCLDKDKWIRTKISKW